MIRFHRSGCTNAPQIPEGGATVPCITINRISQKRNLLSLQRLERFFVVFRKHHVLMAIRNTAGAGATVRSALASAALRFEIPKRDAFWRALMSSIVRKKPLLR